MSDLHYGWRLLRARPGYAAMTILTIALGVGAVTTLFSVAYGVLLRPLSWANGDGLVRVIESRGGREGRIPGTMMNGSFLAWAESPQTIHGIAAWRDGTLTLTGEGDATRVSVASITPNMFEVLRVQPLRGRAFAAGDGATGQPGVAILSTGLWEQRFGAADDVLNRQIVLNGSPYTVIGIMPRSFSFPSGETQLWLPTVIQAVDGPNGVKRGSIFRALARLKPGVSTQQAAAEATARAIAAPDAGPVAMSLFGARDPIQITITDANEAATAEVRPAIVILLIASALLFVTAIANVANMQLARAGARGRELTIRAALGAGTARLGRQLLIENLIVGIVGGIAGLLITVGLHAVLPALLPAGFPRADAIVIDGRVLLLTLLLAVIAGVACGVVPLWHVRRFDLTRAMAEGSMASTGQGRGRLATLRALIVTSQVAVTCVLLVGAMLLVRSFNALATADRGYDPANVLTAAIPFPAAYPLERKLQVIDTILQRVKERPGVTDVARSTALPLASAGGFTFFTFSSPTRSGAVVEAESIRRVVTPGYFGALGIRVKAGRPLSDDDHATAPGAVVVNRSFVRKYLDDIPIERAVSLSLGPRAIGSSNSAPPAYIVGVIDDVKQDRPDGPPQPEMFVPAAQLAGLNFEQWFIVLRTSGDPAGHVEGLRAFVREQDPSLAIDAVMTMDQRVGASLSRPRTYAVLLGGFAVFALVIAGAGLFGVLSQTVAQRSRELAVRSALGASRGAMIAVALKQMAIAILAGLTIGVAASAGLSNSLSPFIYGVSTRDWLSFGLALFVLIVVGCIACVVPARRVATTDPIQILRET
jgi:predicted permease